VCTLCPLTLKADIEEEDPHRTDIVYRFKEDL